MVRLRLRRKGRKGYPVYDVVAVDQRKRRDGGYLERLGYYDPNTRPNTINIDDDRAIYWLNTGAQPSTTVKNLLKYEGILLKRALLFKGVDESAIEAEVEKHKERALERYEKMKKKRKEKKGKGEEAEATQEEDVATEETVEAEETAAEETATEEAPKEEAPAEEDNKEEASAEESNEEETKE